MSELVRNEALRFIDSQGLVRIVTRWPGGRTTTGIAGLSGYPHNHIMLRGDLDYHDPFLDGPFNALPFVGRSDGTIIDPKGDAIWDEDVDGALTNLLIETFSTAEYNRHYPEQ